MSWSEGRESTAATGGDKLRQEALDRVDGLLLALAKDERLQDDLRHPDVQKAIGHWTGRNRLSEDEANELMEENYRIQPFYEKMAELQTCCKRAGIGLPLAHVLAGTGLYPGGVGTETKERGSGDKGVVGEREGGGGGGGARRRRPPASDGAVRKAGAASELETSLEGVGGGGEESWKQALIDELWRVAAVCFCALVFTVLLKYFKGEDPLGGMGGGERADGSGQDEL